MKSLIGVLKSLIGVLVIVLFLWVHLDFLGGGAAAATIPFEAASFVVHIGNSIEVEMKPVGLAGLDVVVDVSTSAHPGDLRIAVEEVGIYREISLGDVSWKSAVGAPAKSTLTIHLTRPPSGAAAVLRLTVAAVSDGSTVLLPGPPGSFAITTASGCGAPPGELPTAAELRTRLKTLEPTVPAGLAAVWVLVKSIDDSQLQPTLAAVIRGVRCVSPGAAPVHPDLVPAAQVKAWMNILTADGTQWSVLRPIINALPDEALHWLYLRAVEAKRKLPVNSLGS